MIDDARLDAILASIGSDLAIARDGSRSALSRGGMSWLTAAAAALVLAVTGVLAVAPARDAVGGWLRLGPTQLHADVDVAVPSDRVPAFVATAPPVAPTAAAAALGAPLPDLAGTPLGAPAAWVVPDEGGVIAVWSGAATTLWLVSLDAGGAMWFDKLVGSARQAAEVDGLGERAVAIGGEHVLQTPLRRVAATSTVLWLDGDVSYRLEADRPLDDLVELARDVAAAG